MADMTALGFVGHAPLIVSGDERRAVEAAIASCRRGNYRLLPLLEAFLSQNGREALLLFGVPMTELSAWQRAVGTE